MITYRPGCKPIFDGEDADKAPAPIVSEPVLPSIEAAMAAAQARDPKAQTELLASPPPLPLVNSDPVPASAVADALAASPPADVTASPVADALAKIPDVSADLMRVAEISEAVPAAPPAEQAVEAPVAAAVAAPVAEAAPAAVIDELAR